MRLPDGAVKRVKAASGDTVDEIMGKLGVGGAGEGLSTDATAGSKVVDGSVSVAALGLGNGDFLYVKVGGGGLAGMSRRRVRDVFIAYIASRD